MDDDEPTEAQQAILNIIVSHVEEHGWPPTVQELCDAVGAASKSTVHYHLKRLEEDGRLRRKAGSPRALAVVDRDDDEEDG